jgi:hypothetical protein
MIGQSRGVEQPGFFRCHGTCPSSVDRQHLQRRDNFRPGQIETGLQEHIQFVESLEFRCRTSSTQIIGPTARLDTKGVAELT